MRKNIESRANRTKGHPSGPKPDTFCWLIGTTNVVSVTKQRIVVRLLFSRQVLRRRLPRNGRRTSLTLTAGFRSPHFRDAKFAGFCGSAETPSQAELVLLVSERVFRDDSKGGLAKFSKVLHVPKKSVVGIGADRGTGNTGDGQVGEPEVGRGAFNGVHQAEDVHAHNGNPLETRL